MSEDDSSSIKPLPIKRRRKSFGGVNGVWWRRRTTPKTTSPSSASSESSSSLQYQSKDESSSPNSNAEIEWDEDLCRPIYRNKTTPLESSSIVSSDGGSSPNGSPTPSSPTLQETTKEDVMKQLWMNAPVKRNKSFGTRKRPYSFLLLDPPSSSQPITSSQESQHSQTTSKTSSTTLSFSDNAQDTKPKRERRILRKDEAALQKAKQFFDHLDATQSLKVESSHSQSTPKSSSKITRTSYKLNLQSPRIQQEYQAYSKASRESGVSPYSIEKYAASRRDFFRKGDLFDGFLDHL